MYLLKDTLCQIYITSLNGSLYILKIYPQSLEKHQYVTAQGRILSENSRWIPASRFFSPKLGKQNKIPSPKTS